MLESFCPKMYVESIFAIDGDRLWEQGIRGIIFDLDNTLIPWQAETFSVEAAQWIEMMKARGFQLCVVSNAWPKRVASLMAPLGIPALSRARKPAGRAFRRAMALMKTTAAETAVVGDQLFTDILGGNRLGLYTILVRPLSSREFLGTRLVRTVEKFFLAKILQEYIHDERAN